MNLKKRGLGKGLSDLGLGELLGSGGAATQEVSEIANENKTLPVNKSAHTGLQQLALDQLKPGRYQPRQQFSSDKLEELADSIRQQGIIQPIVARQTAQGYEILAGERRWRAAKLAGLETVPVVVRNISDESAIAVSLIENIQRADLNAIEQAQALQRLIEEFALTHEEAAEAVGKNRASVTNLLRLLKLPESIRDYVQQGRLEMGHARALLTLAAMDQIKLAKLVIEHNLSVRETEKRVKQWLAPAVEDSVVTKVTQDPDIRRLEREVSDKLAAKVLLQHQPNGKGKLVIHYNNLDELDGVLKHIA